MSRERPINADVPPSEPDRSTPSEAAEEQPPGPPKQAAGKSAEAPAAPAAPAKPAAEPAKPTEAPKPPPPPPPATKPRRIPGALKGIAALVLLAIVFIVAAVIGGSGGPGDREPAGPAPVTAGGSGREASDGSPSQSATELGYPAFATDNTTRIGGSDPAANAAAAALAVFPSTTPAQRPAAVALAAEGDWQAAIAAAVLMAAPVRAPLLLSAPDGAPHSTEEALSALDPAGGRETGGASFFAIGGAPTPGGAKTTEATGGDPATVAAAIAGLRERLVGRPPAHFVLAPADAPGFAMPAAAWAARSGDPILFAEGTRLPKATAAVLRSHAKVPVYVLGPHSAISAEVAREAAQLTDELHRVSGEDPVANAIAFARYSHGSFGWNVNDPGHGFVLARDDSPLDAAAAAPLSAAGTWGPLLLSDGAATLPAPVRDYFLDVKPGYTSNPTRAFYNHVWVIGDQEAIDVNQQAEVNELAELARIGGEE